MTTIRKMLDLSTAHLPPKFFDEGEGGEELRRLLVAAYLTSNGMMLWVPQNPGDAAEVTNVPPEALKLWIYARSLGCDWVLLDCDADELSELPVYEHDVPDTITVDDAKEDRQ